VLADRTAHDVRYTGKLSNRFRLSQADGWYTHDPIQRVEFINASKVNSLNRDWRSSWSQWITERNMTNARLSQKTHVRVFFNSFILVRSVAKQYILQ